MIKQVFEWLLIKGLVKAAFIINAIAYVVLAIAMCILDWYNKHH